MKHFLISLSLLLASAALADSGPELLWERHWNGVGFHSDEGHVAAVDVDGSVVVMGNSRDPATGTRMVLQRYAANGDRQWSRRFPLLTSSVVSPLYLEPDGSAVFLCRGWDDQQVPMVALHKVDPSGETVWEQRFFGLSIVGSYRVALDRDSDGNWLVAIPVDLGVDRLVKTDPQGVLIWDRTLDRGPFGVSTGMAVMEGDQIVVGGIHDLDWNFIASCSASGDTLWTSFVPIRVGCNLVLPRALPGGGAVFACNDESRPWGSPVTQTWALAADGSLQWHGQYPPEGNPGALGLLDLLVTAEGHTIVVGTRGEDGAFHGQCFDSQGVELWEGALTADQQRGVLRSVATLPDGTLLAGGVEIFGTSHVGCLVSGFTADGDVSFAARWNLEPGGYSQLEDVAVGPDGSFVVVGSSFADDNNGGEQLTILKYAAPVSAVDPVPGPAVAQVDAHPNPFNPMTRIRYTVAEDGPVHLAVYDAAGRHIRTLIQREHVAGQHELTWFGRDDAGRAQASGTYLLRLETSTGVGSSRLTLVR